MPTCEYCGKRTSTDHGLQIHIARCKSKPSSGAVEEKPAPVTKKADPEVKLTTYMTFWAKEHGLEKCKKVADHAGIPFGRMTATEFSTALVRYERSLEK